MTPPAGVPKSIDLAYPQPSRSLAENANWYCRSASKTVLSLETELDSELLGGASFSMLKNNLELFGDPIRLENGLPKSIDLGGPSNSLF